MNRNLYTFFICISLIFIGENSRAQGNWAVGIQFGENLTSLTGDADSEYRLGFSTGAHASHFLLEHLVLRLEVNFERKGAENVFRPDPFAPDVPAEIRLDYLSLPVLLRYTAPVGKVNFAAGGGVGISYLMREVSEFAEGNTIQPDDLNRVDADLILSASVDYPVSKHWTLSFDVRSNFGMVNVQRNDGTARRLGRNISWGMFVGINYYL
jgi:hypothetical protein